ncbi:MAG: hypothetical protein V9F04_06085 [Dermatophilaceae bacterium]
MTKKLAGTPAARRVATIRAAPRASAPPSNVSATRFWVPGRVVTIFPAYLAASALGLGYAVGLGDGEGRAVVTAAVGAGDTGGAVAAVAPVVVALAPVVVALAPVVVALAPVVVALAPVVVAEPVGVVDQAVEGEVMLPWSGAEQATVAGAKPVRATTTAR